MKILFVGMPESVHAARWVHQLADEGWELHLFPVSCARPHALFKGVRVHDQVRSLLPRTARLEVFWPMHVRGMSRVRRWVSRDGAGARARRLARAIRRVQPDIVHSLEIQRAGYLTLAARQQYGEGFPQWVVQNWGSDIALYGQLPDHAARIREVLSACDGYDCECDRDVRLAREFGFRGAVLPVIPNAGGFDLGQVRRLRAPGPASGRRLILLKGYQNWAGRALVGIRALERAADALKDYRIAIYRAKDESVQIAGRLLAARTGLPVEFVPDVSHEEMLRLHGQARVSIGLSICDAASISFLEALAMGAFPVQSDTGAANEWIHNGEGGFIVPAEDPEPVAKAIRRAVFDDELVDRADEVNGRVVAERLDAAEVRQQVVAMYREVAGGPR